MGYKSFLIQKMLGEDTAVYASDRKEWGIYVKKFPFTVYPEMKEIASRSWPDQHGDDEYLPDNPVFKAYNMDVQMVYKGEKDTANKCIIAFLDYLSKGGMFKIYDQHTGIGRQSVRYCGYKEDAFCREENGMDIVEFTVKLKVNDPITNTTLKQ